MLVCKNFDDLLNSEFDVTATTRGYVESEHGRQDICFGITIYSKNHPESVSAYFENLLMRAMKWHENGERPWFEVQTEINNIFLEDSNQLLEGYSHRAYETEKELQWPETEKELQWPESARLISDR